jgi:carbon-monoxide dehydrogenase medium subunit
MYEFKYQRPTSLDAATKSIATAEDGKYLAGGMTLIPTMKQRLAQPSDLIDLGAITELSGIRREGNELVIGATTTHAQVAASGEVRNAIPALADLANHIGDPAVRARGTIGGSIANADPAADYPAAVVGLNATVQTNVRSIAADDFFTGLFETALDDDELVTAVRFPIPTRAAYAKFPNPASRYAVVGVLVSETSGTTRVAVTGAGSSVFRVTEMEKALAANFSPQAVEGISVPANGLNSDIHASDEYRAHLVTVMAKRAVAAAA